MNLGKLKNPDDKIDEIKEHKHCKVCGNAIKQSPENPISDCYNLGICVKCVIKKGIEAIEMDKAKKEVG